MPRCIEDGICQHHTPISPVTCLWECKRRMWPKVEEVGRRRSLSSPLSAVITQMQARDMVGTEFIWSSCRLLGSSSPFINWGDSQRSAYQENSWYCKLTGRRGRVVVYENSPPTPTPKVPSSQQALGKSQQQQGRERLIWESQTESEKALRASRFSRSPSSKLDREFSSFVAWTKFNLGKNIGHETNKRLSKGLLSSRRELDAL